MATAEEFPADDDLGDDDLVDEDEEPDAEAGDDLGDLEAFDDDLAPIVGDEDDEDEDEDEVVPAVPVGTEDDDEEDGPDLDEETDDVEEEEAEESLDVLLARDKAATEDDDLGRLEEPRDGLSVPAIPISAENEFTCRSCFLVKNRAQLADEEQMICFDCA